MVKLRLKRYGKKRQPSYRIIAIESKTRREARPLEELGYYNPRTKETVLETGSLLKWLRYGAQPTDTLQGILKKAGIYNMLEAGEGGVVASIRIPAMAKPEVGIPDEEAAAAETEAEAVAVPASEEKPESAISVEEPEAYQPEPEPVAEGSEVEPETETAPETEAQAIAPAAVKAAAVDGQQVDPQEEEKPAEA